MEQCDGRVVVFLLRLMLGDMENICESKQGNKENQKIQNTKWKTLSV